MKPWLAGGVLILSLALAQQADAATPLIPAVSLTQNDGGTTYSVTLQILGLMTILTLLPALLMTMTSFTRIVIVLAILRQALGMATTPTNQIVIGISLFMTFFIMGPILNDVNNHALQPYMNNKITAQQAFDKAQVPIRKFMLNQTRTNDLQLFVKLSGREKPTSLEAIPMTVIMPAFLTSELKTAFQIGFIIFIPFLIIDLVVASVLMAMGMMMLSPLIISLPFKIMLFVLVDGWTLILGTLAGSFG